MELMVELNSIVLGCYEIHACVWTSRSLSSVFDGPRGFLRKKPPQKMCRVVDEKSYHPFIWMLLILVLKETKTKVA